MTESYTPKSTRDVHRKTAAKFEALNTEVPEAMRTLAEKNIAQTQELYERSKNALEAVMESWERSFDAAGQGAVALNRKVIDIAQRNINSGFDLAKRLAGAKNLAETMELQAGYWREQMAALGKQAEEVHNLSRRVTIDMVEPMQTQMSRGIEELNKASLGEPH
jgi:phasin